MVTNDLIESSDMPVTPELLKDDLRTLGLQAGDTALVHGSLSSLGWVAGGAPTVIDAFQDVLTESGTLVMPTHSGHYSDPGHWNSPSVPDDWVSEIKASIPPYRPEITPTRRTMGRISETFRSYPNVYRSRHPYHSFAAWGEDAKAVVADHSYDFSHGDDSPLAEVYDRSGKIVLLGVTHQKNTSGHLAEHRAEYDKKTRIDGGPIIEDGQRVWKSFRVINSREHDMGEYRIQIGEQFEAEHPSSVSRGMVAQADTRILSQPEYVDFAVDWLERTLS